MAAPTPSTAVPEVPGRAPPAGLRALLATAWRVPGDDPPQRARLRQDQWRAVVDQLPASVLATVVTVGLLLAALGRQADAVRLGPLLFGLALLNGFNFALWWWERHRRAPDASPRGLGAGLLLALDLFVGGVLDALLVLQAAQLVQPGLHAPLVAGLAGAIAAAAWMFALLPVVAVAWVLGACGTLAAGIAGLPLAWMDGLLPLLPLYALVLCMAALLNARLFLLGRQAQHEAARDRLTVSLLLRDFEQHASDWLWEIDAGGRLRHVSQRLAERLGQPVGALVSQPLLALLARHLPADDAEARQRLDQLGTALASDEPLRDHDLRLQVAGKDVWWSLSGRRLGGDGGWRGVGSDVSEARERERELLRLANQDPVTRLANRHQFQRRLALHLGGGGPVSPCTVLLLDLDCFKQVNDSLGHAAGDHLLAAVGERLQESLAARRGSGDLVARLGADEFALLLRGEPSVEAIQRLGKQLRSALRVPVVIDGHEIDVRASIGAASAPRHAQTPDALLRAADLALAAAKAAGRDRLVLFEPALQQEAQERLALLADLRLALDAGQLEMHYQPQIELASGRLVGFEALMRWRHPKRGMVPPAVFIPLAEDGGLIVAMGAWALQVACRDAARWPGELRVAVNVSALQFERSPIELHVLGALESSGLAAERLEIELTESAVLKEAHHAIDLLTRLRALGVRIALDDFGTGFSSLAYLRRLPLDQIKIDRAFIADLDHPHAGGTARAIVSAIHDLAHALGLHTVAEGIETAEQQQVLAELGCGLGQGFLFARPLPRDATQAFVELAHREGLAAAREAQHGRGPASTQAAPWPTTRLPARQAPQLPETRFNGGKS
ncbi:putative bifunctional diguanylate cyclase/phosphodiesterase [Roseateles saccharophilus]|uniref:Diguanylate cyclase (GGDEF)-like protein n=1 Tax=Roseateles saccharophilus TaxID=304 RepID=A0A4R3VBE8_ROSSA|nr:bifunctional diguanylate cyclase/phosphodiesterase [Roseateles saccharophilus]MDG0831653.1 bifunctional diguanylate cyclase/phosphodiesterase [Roseateles saccharophilus]TCV00932.1 diguanylate cyclase (GGDEF)-like protein [Roseateles saccharophilus]